jgi:hypothetical protein
MTEPIAWINAEEIGYMHVSKLNGSTDWKTNLGLVPEENDIPLYTAPQKKEWVGLTDAEILEEYRQSYGDDGNLTDVYFARAIEAKLKEKNTSKKEWVGLTDKEVVMLAYQSQENECTAIRLAEQALKEKNS